MGLDITAYRQLAGAPSREMDAEGCYISSTDKAFIARTDGVKPGVYPSAAEEFGFRAGSYSGYNAWREQLAAFAGYPAVYHEPGYKPAEHMHAAGAWAATGGPFWELIHFSDCEGCIGPRTSAKLARDFAEFQPKADAHPDDWFRQCYSNWRRAFELAADGGAVSFH